MATQDNRPKLVTEHDIDGSYPGVESGGNVRGLLFYHGRVWAITEERDVILLSNDCESDVPLMGQHYQRAGISHTNRIVWCENPLALDFGSFEGYQASPFKMRPHIGEWCGERRWAQAVTLADNKNEAARLFDRCGASFPETICFDAGLDHRMSHFSGSYRFKPAVGATNIGQVTVNNIDELREKVDPKFLREAFQLQRPVDVAEEGSVQYKVINGRAVFFAIVGQYVGKGGHEGNYTGLTRVNNARALLAEAQVVADQLVRLGLKDYLSIDFLVDWSGQHFFTDPNPRRTGATTPCYVAEKIGKSHWTNRLVLTGATSLEQLELASCSLCYTPDKGEGAILTSGFMVRPGVQKVGVMIACTPDRREYWNREVGEWLGSEDLLCEAA